MYVVNEEGKFNEKGFEILRPAKEPIVDWLLRAIFRGSPPMHAVGRKIDWFFGLPSHDYLTLIAIWGILFGGFLVLTAHVCFTLFDFGIEQASIIDFLILSGTVVVLLVSYLALDWAAKATCDAVRMDILNAANKGVYANLSRWAMIFIVNNVTSEPVVKLREQMLGPARLSLETECQFVKAFHDYLALEAGVTPDGEAIETEESVDESDPVWDGGGSL